MTYLFMVDTTGPYTITDAHFSDDLHKKSAEWRIELLIQNGEYRQYRALHRPRQDDGDTLPL